MELFVRKCNLRLYERNWAELDSSSPAGGRAHVNRTAFELFCGAYTNASDLTSLVDFIYNQDNISKAEVDVSGVELLEQFERVEVSELARRMWYHFRRKQGNVVLKPRFRGCGVINSCVGDVQVQPGHIVELKDGDRAFRSYEFRQLSVYAALFLNETGEMPSSIEVLNSRRGTSVSVSIDDFADEVAGQSGVDYLREIVRVVSDLAPSL